MDLFNQTSAQFSPCRKYRYVLCRIWDESKSKVMFVGLNPSVADENSDDPTIRRVKKFAFTWGFGGVYMCNLFGLITPYPEDLRLSDDPIGENDTWLQKIGPLCQKIVFAWGNFNEAKERSRKIIEMFPGAHALIINKDGSPRHPLYVPGNVKTIPFK